jgi:hypothetical protein
MTIGMCMDYIQSHVELRTPHKSQSQVRKASQTDFDSF